MPHMSPDKIAEIIREVAAEKIVPRFRQLAEHEISTKSGPTDLVTIADLEAEIELTRIFKDILPGSIVVGEEAVSKSEISMDLLGSESGYIWVIDPVDGTGNFASGDERHGTIVALVKDTHVVQGWILDIPNDRMGIAEQGAGVEINGVPQSYNAPDTPLKEMRGFISRKFLPPKMRDELKDVMEENFSNIEPHMCCAHEYMDILQGKAHFSLYSRIRPWDHLAGAFMLQEAGGHVRKWDKSAYLASDQRGGLICTPNVALWNEIHALLLEKYV